MATKNETGLRQLMADCRVKIGTKLNVCFLFLNKAGQLEEGNWRGWRLIGATTSCPNCGYNWSKTDNLLSGVCPNENCKAIQPKIATTTIESRGAFKGKDTICFRVYNRHRKEIRTVVAPSLVRIDVRTD